MSKEAKNACIKYGQYHVLPGCLEIYAKCCHFLGEDNESEDAYCEAYYICKVIGQQKDLKTVKKEAIEYLGTDFTKNII